MSNNSFKVIGLIGKPDPASAESTTAVIKSLIDAQYDVVVEETLADTLNIPNLETCDKAELGKQSDFAIVVGGDGSMLNASRVLAQYQTPVVGINRGYFGFLTDISPTEVPDKVLDILSGQYQIETRFLLETDILHHGKTAGKGLALNDIVLSTGTIARMLEFEVSIDGEFVYSQRSDGLIVSTPTGSTAYALSGGGPILHPSLDAIVLVPKFPHTLSSRPIVIDAQSEVSIKIGVETEIHPQISCDGQDHFAVFAGDEIRIKRHSQPLQLVHPTSYQYYHVLRNKLGWSSKLAC